MQTQNHLPYGQGNHFPTKPQSLPAQGGSQVHFIPTAPQIPVKYDKYAGKTSRALGICRIIIPSLMILALIALMATGWGFFFLHIIIPGILCGILSIVAGSYGVVAAGKKSNCTITANMVLAILSIIFFDSTFIALFGWLISPLLFSKGVISNSLVSNIMAVPIAGLSLIGIQLICDIWSAVICCKVVCCGRPASNMTEGQNNSTQNTQAVNSTGQVNSVQQPQGYSVAYNAQAANHYQGPMF